MWMGISTNGIGKISMPVETSTSKESSKTDVNGSFADIMELSSQAKADTTATTKPVTDDSQTKSAQADINTTNVSDKADRQSNAVEDVNKYEQQSRISGAEETKVVDEVPADENIDSLKDEIFKVIGLIYDILEEKLGCTEQEIEDVLENMGLLIEELIVPNTIRDVVLQMNDASEVDLLISEQLPNLVTDIQDAIADILDDFGITSEDVSAFLETLKAGETEVLDVKAEETMVSQDEQSTKTQAEDNEEILINVEYNDEIIHETAESNGPQTNANTSRDNASSVIANLNQKIEQVLATEQPDSINEFQTDVAQADIVRQVIEAVRVNLSGNQTSMILQLNPENLGRVQISVIQKNGIMQAQIIAENETAKNAIDANIALLQESLEHQELKVESVEVMVASYDFFNHQEQQSNEQNSNQARRRTALGGLEGFEEEVADDNLENEILKAQGNSVNYSI